GRPFRFELPPPPEPAVHFNTCGEILSAPCARIRAGSQSQGPAGAEGITELPNAFMNVFHANQILGNIPSLDLARQDQFGFELSFVLQSCLTVGLALSFLSIEPDNFFQCLIGAIKMFIFDVENGIDTVLAHQETKSILESKAREQAAIMSSVLAVYVKLGCPPSFRAIFDFSPVANKGRDA